MKAKPLVAIPLVSIAVFALSSAAFADMFPPAKMTDQQLDQVIAGCGGYPCPPPPIKVKGNNGWGNGADGTNPGSFKGKTAPSKIGFPEGTGGNVPGATGVNANPTTSTGR